jgi:hypothetical protein
MKDNILNLILVAERDYLDALDKARLNGERYVDERRKAQDEFLEELKQEWLSFEKAEDERLQKMFVDEQRRMEAETVEQKKELKRLQEVIADTISQRLKEEVLSIYGDS